MKITSPDDLNPKRFPRKTKKKFIKAWGREVYKGILKGTYILLQTYPYMPPNQNNRMYPYDFMKKQMAESYKNKEINHDLYEKIELRAIYQYEK